MTEIPRQEAARLLANVPPEHVFRFADGGFLSNMAELAESLKKMSDDVFAFHVNSQKNDFHNWVRDIFKDELLSAELLNAKTKRQAANRVTKRLALLQAALG